MIAEQPFSDSYLIGSLCAVGTAVCWAITPLIAIGVVRQIGAVTFARMRITVGAILVGAVALTNGGFGSLTVESFAYLAMSGLSGVVFGELLLYLCFQIVGVRMGTLIYAGNSPLTIILGYLWLGESIRPMHILAIIIILVGVTLAVVMRNTEAKNVDKVVGSLATGVLAGVGAALAQAIGSIAAKPALLHGVDPITAVAVRMSVAAMALFLVAAARSELKFYLVSRSALLVIAASATVSMGIGLTLLMVAISLVPVGLASALSSLSPVIVLPIIAIGWKEKVNVWCWIGAALSLVGGWLTIFS